MPRTQRQTIEESLHRMRCRTGSQWSVSCMKLLIWKILGTPPIIVAAALRTPCTRCLRKVCAKLFMSELCQISINFNNFWQVDGKVAETLWYIYTFSTSPHSCYRTTLLNKKSTTFYSL